MIQVTALTSGRMVPSSLFRVRQHIQPLRELGIEVREYIPAVSKYGFVPRGSRQVYPVYMLPLYAIWQGVKLATRLPGISASWHSQVTWLERELLAGCFTLEWSLKRPVVLDVDDAIWLTPPFGSSATKSIAQRADVVVAGNSYLADWFSKYANDVRIIPTAVDTDRMIPRTYAASDSSFVVGWTGLGPNLPYLYAIEEPLRRFMSAFPDVEMHVIADVTPCFKSLPPERVKFIRWSYENEVKALQQIDVGLMPLPDNEWTRGKCSFKMLQYMACGIPSLVSPVGMNAEILAMGRVGFPAGKDEDWYAALEHLYLDRSCARECGVTGRIIVEQYFSRRIISQQLGPIFREIA